MAQFSIVTPVFNGMPWLPSAIHSVLSQESVDVELIVLDGGSTDGSREWLEANVAAHATLVFEPDAGQTDALARGFALATGSYFGWLNADDVLEPGALARVADAFASAPYCSLVSGCCLQIDSAGDILGIITPPPSPSLEGLLQHPHNLAQPATFFRADSYRRSRGLDRALGLAMDVDLWLQLAKLGEIVLMRDLILARFRIHEASKTVSGSTASAREDLRVRRRHGMKLLSRAGWVLFKRAYLRPLKPRRTRLT